MGKLDAKISFKTLGCDHQVNVAIDVNSRKGPSLVLLRPRQLVIDFADKSVGDLDIRDLRKLGKFISQLEMAANDPFSDDYQSQSTTAKAILSGLSTKWNDSDHQTSLHFISDGVVLSKITTQELPETLTMVLPDRNPDTCIIHNPQLGWATIDSPEITSDRVTLSDVRFTSGVNVTVQCSFECMSVFPSELRLCHTKGAIIRKEFDYYQAKENFAFPQLWPGCWSIELIGIDPYLGELILDRREVDVGSSKAISIELGSGK